MWLKVSFKSTKKNIENHFETSLQQHRTRVEPFRAIHNLSLKLLRIFRCGQALLSRQVLLFPVSTNNSQNTYF